MRRAAATLCLAVALAWTAAARGQDAPRAPAGDSVTCMENGARKTRTGVVVESADYEHVVFVQAAKRATLDGADVVEVRWGDAPREFDAAVAALRRGDAAAAADGFEAALVRRGTTRAWILEEANTGLGEALLALVPRGAAATERTARVFAAARDANPKSLLSDRILLGLARAEILRGRPDAAVDAALALAASAKTAKRPAWEADAEVARAEALDEKNDRAGALSALDAFLEWAPARAASTKDADLARRLAAASVRAAVRKTWLLVAAAEAPGATDAAERARKFVAETAARWPADASVAAAAIDAEGALFLAAGDAKAALRKFIEAEVAHFDVPEEAARALRYEAIAFERLGDTARSAESLRLLARTYPASEAARRTR
jgi:hypothetical protein